MTDVTDEEDADLKAFESKTARIAALAAELCDGDTGEMLVLLAAASAWVTMLPFNGAKTIAESEARIAGRTPEQETHLNRTAELFVDCYRGAMPMARTTAMVLLHRDAMPPAGSA
jgi:hypothetical protein